MHQAQTNSQPGVLLLRVCLTGRWVGVLECHPLCAPRRASLGQDPPVGPGREGPDVESGPISDEKKDNCDEFRFLLCNKWDKKTEIKPTATARLRNH